MFGSKLKPDQVQVLHHVVSDELLLRYASYSFKNKKPLSQHGFGLLW